MLLYVNVDIGSYAWSYRELENFLTLSESLAEGEFKPLNIRSMDKNLTSMSNFAVYYKCRVNQYYLSRGRVVGD